jgi:hypothetical protein
MTLAEFVQKHRIRMKVKPASSNPAMQDDEWSRGAHHWLCTLTVGKRDMQVHFSQGSAIQGAPTVEHVLSSLGLDAASYLNARSFEDWAADLGYDADSRKAERTYRLVAKETKALERLLGRAALEELAFETESL